MSPNERELAAARVDPPDPVDLNVYLTEMSSADLQEYCWSLRNEIAAWRKRNSSATQTGETPCRA